MNRDYLNGRWARIPDRCLFRITGPDRARYLNGQVTNNVMQDLSAKSLPACLCSLKGKVEALVWITDYEGALLVDGEIGQRESIFERLDRYHIADDCEIEDVTGSMTLIHNFGLQAAEREAERYRYPASDIWLNSEEEIPLDVENELSEDDLQRESILGKIPEWSREITGDEFPAELGLDKWAVDFHKGCYLGQEVVSRIQSVGKVKRSLDLITADDEIRRDSLLRNNENELGKATRAGKRIEEKKWIGLGLFGRVPKDEQSDDFQYVTKLSP